MKTGMVREVGKVNESKLLLAMVYPQKLSMIARTLIDKLEIDTNMTNTHSIRSTTVFYGSKRSCYDGSHPEYFRLKQ